MICKRFSSGVVSDSQFSEIPTDSSVFSKPRGGVFPPLLFWDFSFPVNDSVYDHQLSSFLVCQLECLRMSWTVRFWALGSLVRSDLYGKGELEISGSRAVTPDWAQSSYVFHVTVLLLFTSDNSFLVSVLPKRGDAYSFGFPAQEKGLYLTKSLHIGVPVS